MSLRIFKNFQYIRLFKTKSILRNSNIQNTQTIQTIQTSKKERTMEDLAREIEEDNKIQDKKNRKHDLERRIKNLESSKSDSTAIYGIITGLMFVFILHQN